MGLNQAYQLDDLDLQILDILIKDCRTPYLEIARLCHVSGGTIHVRMKKMEELGIIKGTKTESGQNRKEVISAEMRSFLVLRIGQQVNETIIENGSYVKGKNSEW